MIVTNWRRSWSALTYVLAAMLAMLAVCQAIAAEAAVASTSKQTTEALTRFGDTLAIIRAKYAEPISTSRLLTLGLRGIESGGSPLPPGAHKVIQDGSRAVETAADDPARILAFSNALSLLAGGQAADKPRLLRAATLGMVSGLDPHSAYVSATGSVSIVGALSGLNPNDAYTPAAYGSLSPAAIGLELKEVDHGVVVIQAFPNSPAALAGIKRGDVLVQIDGQPVRGGNLTGVVDRLRGPPGSRVQLGLRRSGQTAELHIPLVRQRTPQPAFSSTLRDGAALIRPGVFIGTTLVALRMALAARTAEAGGRLSGLILDLRDNGGGLFSNAVEVAGELLPAGASVVTLESRGALGSTAIAHGGSLPANVPMVVVVNGHTGAGAELVAAALSDSRAVLLGSRTFGDATVQTVFPMRAGNGASFAKDYVRLTTGRMLPPAGPSWQRRGLVPDIPVESMPEGSSLKREDSLPGALPTGPATGSSRSGVVSVNPLRDRLASITPQLLAIPRPADTNADFEIEQAMRVLNLLGAPSAVQ